MVNRDIRAEIKMRTDREDKLDPDHGPDLVSAAVTSTSAVAPAVAVEFFSIAGVEASAAAAPRLPPVAVTAVICAAAIGAAGVAAGVC